MTELETLRELENAIIANSMASVIEDKLYQPIVTSELGIDAWMNDSSHVANRSTDLHTAISLLVSKLSIFSDLTPTVVVSFGDMTISEYSVYERAFYFGITNCNGNIRVAAVDTCDALKNYYKDMFSSISRVSIVFGRCTDRVWR